MHGSIKESCWVIVKLSLGDNLVAIIGVISPWLAVVVIGNQMQIRFPHVFSLQRSRILFAISTSIVYKYNWSIIGHFGDFIIV